jgi:hypothetical protein
LHGTVAVHRRSHLLAILKRAYSIVGLGATLLLHVLTI